jgi:hypothetical protein
LPLAINLLAHLVDSDSCSNVLSRWQEEKTSVISQGYDRRSNLDLSISLSLSSPRLAYSPHSLDLLSLLAILPDGLSDTELIQSKLLTGNILGCKISLLATSLAHTNENHRLKLLVPVREYIYKIKPPSDQIIQPLLKYFQDLLELYHKYSTSLSRSQTISRISLNYSNIKSVLQTVLQKGHPDLVKSIYCACNLNNFSGATGQGKIILMSQISSLIPPYDHRLEVYFITELFRSWTYYPISDPDTLVAKALQHFVHFDDTDMKCMVSFQSVVS